MLQWSLGFLLVAIFAATFGFAGTTSGAPGLARIVVFFFLVISGITLVYGLVAERTPPAAIP